MNGFTIVPLTTIAKCINGKIYKLEETVYGTRWVEESAWGSLLSHQSAINLTDSYPKDFYDVISF